MMRSPTRALWLVLGAGLLLAGGPAPAAAQPVTEDVVVPPPPPPPPSTPQEWGPAPVEPPPAARPPQRRRTRYRPSPWGRFYLGLGGGYVLPGSELGEALKGGGAYGAWVGWRKGWIGFELGYLGATLEHADLALPIPNTDTPTTGGTVLVGAPPRTRLSHVTGDVKLFMRLFCRTTLFARVGVNYTELKPSAGARLGGAGYQYGAGVDHRIRLSFRPDLILKLRAEVVHINARVAVEESDARYAVSGLYMMFYVNLGWSPR